jgi:hypothetical protein
MARHLVEHVDLAFLGGLRILERIVGGWGLRQTGDNGGLVEGQVACPLGEISL